MIEKKILIFGLFVLLLLPASALAADGDSSPESTIVFSETLPDDIMFYPDNETHGTGYAESFTDVSEWSAGDYAMESGDSFSSDGDLLSMECAYDAGDQLDSIKVTVPSLSTDHYVEFRWRVNATKAGGGADRIYLRLNDDASNNYQYNNDPTDTNWHTYKALISSLSKNGNPTSINYVQLMVYFDTATDEVDFEVDYLRIANSTSMGWQHDGSTTAGFEQYGSGYTYSSSSDGDVFTGECTYDASDRWAGISLYQDTTATKVRVERDYYPFIEVRVRVNWTGATGLGIWFQYDNYGVSWPASQNGEWLTVRKNIKAATIIRNYDYIWFYGHLVNPSDTFSFEVDYTKIFSIANFSLTQSGINTANYLYVEDGVLHSLIHAGYIELNHDPTLSVVPDTYPLYYNLSTIGTAPEFSMYVSSWSTYSDETRGIISSRIVTDIKLKFDSTEIISEIGFAMDDISIFDELFLSLDMWGYLGPMAMIVIGYVLAKKEKFLGVLWFAVECLFVTQYLALVEAMPDYWWHIFILLLGGLFTCVYPLLDR